MWNFKVAIFPQTQNFKQRHSMYVRTNTTGSAAALTLPSLPTLPTTSLFSLPAVTRTESRYSFLPTMRSLSSVSSPMHTEEFNDEEFHSPSHYFTLTADKSTQTVERTLVPHSTAPANSGSPLEQSTQNLKTVSCLNLSVEDILLKFSNTELFTKLIFATPLQNVERRDISMVEKEELDARLQQLKLKFEVIFTIYVTLTRARKYIFVMFL